MKTCARCHSTLFHEPFTDAFGSGDAWCCLACGEREENYTQWHNGAMTEAQISELMQPSRRGRPPGRRL